MRMVRFILVAVGMVGCAGAVEFESEEDENGFPIFETIDIVAGGQGQRTLTLLVEGTYAGTYDFTVTPDDDTIATGSLSVGSAEVEADVPFDLTVTIDIADTATAADNGNVFVEAMGKRGSAGTTVSVNIVE